MLDVESWQAISAAVVAVGSAVALGVRIGQQRERERVAVKDSEALTHEDFSEVAVRHFAEHQSTRALIVAVKEGDRAMLRELKDSFANEMRELRTMEGRQNELLAGVAAEFRGATDALRRASLGRLPGV